jgi:hypothetical protein
LAFLSMCAINFSIPPFFFPLCHHAFLSTMVLSPLLSLPPLPSICFILLLLWSTM